MWVRYRRYTTGGQTYYDYGGRFDGNEAGAGGNNMYEHVTLYNDKYLPMSAGDTVRVEQEVTNQDSKFSTAGTTLQVLLMHKTTHV